MPKVSKHNAPLMCTKTVVKNGEKQELHTLARRPKAHTPYQCPEGYTARANYAYQPTAAGIQEICSLEESSMDQSCFTSNVTDSFRRITMGISHHHPITTETPGLISSTAQTVKVAYTR